MLMLNLYAEKSIGFDYREDTDSGCDVSCTVYMLPYILDAVSYIEVLMS